MKNTLKFLGIGFALVLLVMSQQFSTTPAAEAVNKVAENDVQWLSIGGGATGTANAATKATKVKYYAPSDIASFFIRDDVLNSVTTGQTEFKADDVNQADVTITVDADADCSNAGAEAGECFNLQTAVDNPKAELDATEQTTAGVTSTAYAGANTPLVPGSLIVKKGDLELTDFKHKDETAGKFSFATAHVIGDGDATQGTAANKSVIASYSFNTQQTYANSGSSDLNALRAKVTSTSDSTGEWIAITETDSEGGAHNAAATAANNSSIFVGRVAFSTDAAAAAAGTVSGGVRTVWVADGDTVTVTYYAKGTDANADGDLAASEVGAVIDTATFTIDAAKPTVTNISPADGTLTKDTSPQISFTIEDSGIGFESTSATIGNHVDLSINGCTVLDSELNASSHSTSSITITYDLATTKKFSDLAVRDTGANIAAGACTLNGAVATTRSGTHANGPGGFGVVTDGNQADTTLDRTINGTKFTWEIIARDDAGNTNTITGTKLEVYMDSVIPTVSSVTGASKWDAVAKAPTTTDAADTIQILMSESIDPATVDISDFVVSGTGVTDSTISAVSLAGDDATTNKYIYLTLGADLGPNATPKVELVGQISDLAGNVFKVPSGDSDGKVDFGTAATDGVKSTISNIAIDDKSLDTLEKATMTFTANENLVTSGSTAEPACTCVYVFGDTDNNAATGFVPQADNSDANLKNFIKVDVELTSTQNGKATFTQGTSPISKTPGIYGVLVRGRDAAGNIGLGGLTKVTNEDISSKFTSAVNSGTPITVKLKNGPIGDPDAGANIDLRTGTITVTDDGASVTPTLTNINWSEAEEITFTLGSNVAAGSQVRLTYHYFSPESVIEVDTAAPTVTVTPSADSSTEDARTRISFAFDEDEYAFDSMTTVTVTKAELKNVSTKEVTDILPSLITSDNKNFYYKPTSDLAVGQYEVKVSAKDTNANALTDSTSKFTVVERSKTTVAMEAGWNLISLPGTPVDTDINSVITNTETTTVLTYDPSTPGGWLTAVRDGGSLVGTLTTMDASKGYWIYQEDGDDIKTLIPGSTSGVQQVPPSISLVKGWNLVPMVTLNLATTAVEADDYFANVDWNKAKGWKADKALWYDINKGVDIVDIDSDGSVETEDLNPGDGYWLFANKAGTLVP